MNTFPARHVSAVILLLLSVALWFYDDWMSWSGDKARVTELFLMLTTHAPVTTILFVFWAGIVVGHLFLPQTPLATEKS